MHAASTQATTCCPIFSLAHTCTWSRSWPPSSMTRDGRWDTCSGRPTPPGSCAGTGRSGSRLWRGGTRSRPAGRRAPYDERLAELYQPERMLVGELAAYPAHLHIDVLPDYQRRGYGRRLIETLLDALGRAGAGGVHLGVGTANVGAQEFYKRVGFDLVPAASPTGSVLFFGRRTSGGHDR